MPGVGPERGRNVFHSNIGTEGKREGGLLSLFSMETMEGACFTGGLISIWGPPHQSEHDCTLWHMAGGSVLIEGRERRS